MSGVVDRAKAGWKSAATGGAGVAGSIAMVVASLAGVDGDLLLTIGAGAGALGGLVWPLLRRLLPESLGGLVEKTDARLKERGK